MAHAGRWRKPLAALPFVAATAAAALPTVVSLSEDPQLTGWPGGFWADGADDGGGDGAACARDAGPWSLSRMVEDVMQQLATSEAEDRVGKAFTAAGSLESAAEAETAEDTPGACTEAAVAALVLPASRHAQHPASHRSGPASSGGPAVRLPRGAEEPTAASLAIQHSADVAEMRQLALAELARMQATSAGLGAHSLPGQQQQQQQQPGKQRWGKSHRRAAAAEGVGQPSHEQDAGALGAAPAPVAASAAGVCPGAAELPPGFTDAELMRYAAMFGFLRAVTPQQRQASLREGAAAAARTVQWLQRYPFASAAELDNFSHLISWEGTDAAGHPVLRISIGKAVTECRGAAALAFANAIITHIETLAQRQTGSQPASGSVLPDSASASSDAAATYAVATDGAAADAGVGTAARSSGGSRATVECSTSGAAPSAAPLVSPAAASQPDQVVVLMDCTGASALNAARMSWVFQSVASTLSHHYPGRMRELVLLDLPGMLSWMVKPVQQLVHPDTRHKFKAMQREQYNQHRQQHQHHGHHGQPHHRHQQHGKQHQHHHQQHGQQQHHQPQPQDSAGAAEQAQQAIAPLQ